jgi:cytoskeletal protein CcmA (bactofilin family)
LFRLKERATQLIHSAFPEPGPDDEQFEHNNEPRSSYPAISINVLHNVEEPSSQTLLIADGIGISGNIRFAKSVFIEGIFNGSADFIENLVIGKNGIFTTSYAEVQNLTVLGKLKGSVAAYGSVVVASGGIIEGHLRCSDLQIFDGGRIDGLIDMDSSLVPRERILEDEAIDYRDLEIKVWLEGDDAEDYRKVTEASNKFAEYFGYTQRD